MNDFYRLLESLDSITEDHRTYGGATVDEIASAIHHRIAFRYPELYSKYGTEFVDNFVQDEAEFHEGTEELGSSDVSGMVQSVIRMIERSMAPKDEELDEATESDSTIEHLASLLDRYNEASANEHDAYMAREGRRTNAYIQQMNQIVDAILTRFDLFDADGKRITAENFNAYDVRDVDSFIKHITVRPRKVDEGIEDMQMGVTSFGGSREDSWNTEGKIVVTSPRGKEYAFKTEEEASKLFGADSWNKIKTGESGFAVKFPETVNDDLEEGLGKKLQRGLKGWEGTGHPKELVQSVRDMDDATLIRYAKRSGYSKGSPADVQQRLIRQELKRRFGLTPKGDVKEASPMVSTDGQHHNVVDADGNTVGTFDKDAEGLRAARNAMYQNYNSLNTSKKDAEDSGALNTSKKDDKATNDVKDSKTMNEGKDIASLLRMFDSTTTAKEKLDESMNISINSSSDAGDSVTVTATDEQAYELLSVLRAAGIAVPGSETSAPVTDIPVDAAPTPCELAAAESVEEERELANSPNEVYGDMETLLNKVSGGLNSEKKQYKKEYPGDNPMAVAEDELDEETLDEKWGTETQTPEKEKGKYKGKNVTELRSQYNKLKKSGPHSRGSKEFEKMRELAFAIRAKTGWGKVQEDEAAVETAKPDDNLAESLYAEYQNFLVEGTVSEKAVNPYAIGMTQAMKTTGDKPPLKKKTITKAHDIAKAVMANEDESAPQQLEIDDVDDLEVEGVNTWDAPDFADAYFSYGIKNRTGEELTDEELEMLTDKYPDVVNTMASEKYI